MKRKRKNYRIFTVVSCLLAVSMLLSGCEKEKQYEVANYQGQLAKGETTSEYNENLFYRNDKKANGADPFVLDNTEVDGYYYLYGTEGMNFCYRSKNMMDWEPIGNALGEWKYDDEGKIEEACKVVWADVWAPEVVYDPEEEFYYMFFSATPQADKDVTTTSASGSARRQLLVARSKFPYMDFELVNFKDAKSCGEENLHTFSSDSFPHYYAKYLMLDPNIYNEFVDKNGGDTERHNYGGYSSTIDAHAYVDENGDKYLFWKDELIEDRICGVKMDNWLKPDWSTATVLMYEGYYTVEDYWKAEQGQVVEEVSYESNNAQNNEAPTVIKHNGKYYMIFSMGNYSDNSYQAAQAVADNILGPYRKLREEEGGLLLAGGKVGSQDLTGLGHQDLVTIGEQLYIIYHRHDDAMVGGGPRNPAIDEIRWITIQDESGKDLDVMYVNGPTCTVQPRIEAYSTYSNIADEATVSGIEEAQYLTDGLLSICKYGNESFMQYIKESTIKETSTVVFDFDSARSVCAIMVYNSKLEDTSFMKVSNVEFVCIENGQEVVRYIDDIKFSPEFYRANDLDNSMYYITPGAAAYAEFEELNVKSVRITVEVPEGQETVGISEIRILGK